MPAQHLLQHPHPHRDSASLRGSYLKMVKSDSSTSLLDNDAHSVSPYACMPFNLIGYPLVMSVREGDHVWKLLGR